MKGQENEPDSVTESGTNSRNLDEGRTKVGRTPLPVLQLAIILLIEFTEPLTATVIYPFVIQCVRNTGITGGDETKTGYYAGIIESLFFFTETATVFTWTRLSDLIGRKPVLLLGPMGLTMSVFGFSLSTNYWALLFFRASQGIFNGNIGVSGVFIAEVTDETNIGDAYALVPLQWRAGVTIGPMLGGLLSDPAVQWPEIFGKSEFFLQHPYFLPSAAAGIISFLVFGIASVGLKETRPRKHTLKQIWGLFLGRRGADREDTTPLLVESEQTEYGTAQGRRSDDTPPETQLTQGAPEAAGRLSRLATRPYITTVANYGLFAFMDMAMSALIPLTYATPIEYGGLGMEPYLIGILMASLGIFTGLFTAFFLGPILRRFGAARVFQVGVCGFLITFSALAMASVFAKRSGRIDACVLSAVALQIVGSTFFAPSYASMSVLVVQASPSKESRGAAIGAAQMVTSASRAFAPAVASSLFSISISRNLAGGYAVYWIFLALAVVLVRVSRFIVPASNASEA